MQNLLLVESGSTKTDWCLISENKEKRYCQTIGLNPYHLSTETCLKVLEEDLNLKLSPEESENMRIVFYGAGVNNEEKADFVKSYLKQHFKTDHVEAYSDLLASSRATCGQEKGIVCILGTGSNSGYFNGKEIEFQTPSLGYIIGDEGSGVFLGKKVLQYYFYNTFDDELKSAFEFKYGNNLHNILHKVYKEPFGNRYLASFATFLKENRHHFMIENIIEDAFIDFHQRHVLKYRQSWTYPIHFTGSIAYEFRDILIELHSQFGLETGKILKSPLEGLIHYHQEEGEVNLSL